MSENKNFKLSLSTFLLILAIICIIIMGYYINALYNDNMLAIKEIVDLNHQIIDLQNSNNNSNIVSNTVNNNNDDNKYVEITENLEGIDVLYVTEAIKNEDKTYTLKGRIYTQYTLSNTELKQILNQGSMEISNESYEIKNSTTSNEYDLFQPDVEIPLFKIKPLDDATYYLEAQVQTPDVWKLTDKYREITLSGDTKCSINSETSENTTVDDVFKNYEETEPIDTTNPNTEKTFTFNFVDGKCVEVIGAFTAV